MLDLRLPSGLFFLAVGLILVVLGIANPSLEAPMTTANVNLYTGCAMVVFGGTLLWLSQRKA